MNYRNKIQNIVGFHAKIAILIFAYISILHFFKIGCPFRYFSSIPCPTCGMTRALYSVYRFEGNLAFKYHPLWIFIPPYLFIALHNDTLFRRFNKKWMLIFIHSGALLVFLVYLLRFLNIGTYFSFTIV